VEPSRARAGRPRHEPQRRQGATAREEILDAAAQLFTEDGYAATPTRAIAGAVGIKQASLYYHFASKEDLLAELLVRTVLPSLAFAEAAASSNRPPEVQLYALTAFDVELMCSGPWNLGALYLLPEVRTERFAGFREDRARLLAAYEHLVVAGAATGVFSVENAAVAARLVFALAESVITLRWETGDLDAAALGEAVATGGLRLLSMRAARLATVRSSAAALATRLVDPAAV
jgi:AcrR family transcriptional regulator